jgi:N-methylhydantoinase A
MHCRIGIDIGGTFTDFALFDDRRRDIVTHKRLTTPGEPERAVLDGLQALLQTAGAQIGDVAMVVHGTTLVTNAAIERRGAPTAMLVTRGFRDVPDIAQEQRYDLYDLRLRFPPPLVPRQWRFEVPERITWDGQVREPLDLSALQPVLEAAVAQHGLRAVAVCLLHSYANAQHEEAVGDWLAQHFPALQVSLSAQVFPFAREYARWTSTCLNAYVQPLADAYIGRLERGLQAVGFAGRFLIMGSSGSTLTPEMARRFPIRLLESGPAAGALMAARHSRDLALPQILAFDMGGTTAKGCVVADHTPLKRYDFEVARVHEFKRGSGLPVKVPVIDMIEIGSGGGSLAGLDPRGVLRVGPRSAGAVPGPACYARGGRLPTLTDANLVLGYLDATSFLGGQMALDVQAARDTIAAQIGAPTGTDLARAAWGIHEVVNEDVAKAFRVHASERGVDHRRCSMVVFGGSGPVHGARIARKLRVPRVISPAGAGVMSAFGLLASPVGFELVQSQRVALQDLDATGLAQRLDSLAARVRAQLGAALGDAAQGTVRVRLDMRYIGQGYEVEVALPPQMAPAQAHAALGPLFAAAYAAVFGQSFADRPVEIVAWKVEIQGPVPGLDGAYTLRPDAAPRGPALKGRRPAWFADGPGYQDTPVYDRYALRPGDTLRGPALVEENESTCVLAPGDIGHIDAQGHLLIDIAGGFHDD